MENIKEYHGLIRHHLAACSLILDDPAQCFVECELAVWRALQRYDSEHPSGASLATYLSRTIKNEIITSFRAEQRQNPLVIGHLTPEGTLLFAGEEEGSFIVTEESADPEGEFTEELILTISLDEFTAYLAALQTEEGRLVRILGFLRRGWEINRIAEKLAMHKRDVRREIEERLYPSLRRFFERGLPGTA